MNPRNKIANLMSDVDARLIGLFQGVVDASALKPEAWARRCVGLLAVVSVCWFSIAFKPDSSGSWITLLFDLAAVTIYWLMTLSQPRFRYLGSLSAIRLILGAWALGYIPLLLSGNIRLSAVVDLATVISGGMYCYFAACRDPRPRVRRDSSPKLAKAAGGA